MVRDKTFALEEAKAQAHQGCRRRLLVAQCEQRIAKAREIRQTAHEIRFDRGEDHVRNPRIEPGHEDILPFPNRRALDIFVLMSGPEIGNRER